MWMPKLFGTRSNRRHLSSNSMSVGRSPLGRHLRPRHLLLEPLEDRALLSMTSLPASGSDLDMGRHELALELASQLTTTGSTEQHEYHFGSGAVGFDDPQMTNSSPLINLDAFRADPRFAGMDGSGLAVVVLDTGIELDHPHFGPDSNTDGVADRIVFHYDFYDNDADATDFRGHGTHVTGTIASSDPTFTGVAPGVDIIHLKVFPDTTGGAPISVQEQALQWAVANAAVYDIVAVNMSLGSGNYQTAQTVHARRDEFEALAALNVLTVASSGNDFFPLASTPGVALPSADPDVISVGSVWAADFGGPITWGSGAIDYTTGPDRIVSHSQRHPELTDTLAPGARITAAWLGGGTNAIGGTSMASPHVAGAAVLAQQIAQTYLGTLLDVGSFRNLLQTTGVTIFDGDDEDDNVVNTLESYPRLDMLALADAVFQMSGPTMVSLIGGDILIEDMAPGGKDDTLIISISPDDSSVVRIHDPNNVVGAGTGATQVDPNTVEIPLSLIPGAIIVNTRGGTDLLTVDLSNGNPVPSGGINYDGGTGGDALRVVGSAADEQIVVDHSTGVSQVTVDVSAPIRFIDTESIQIDGMSGNDTLIVDFSGGDPVPVSGIHFNGGAGNDAMEIHNGSFSTITKTFVNPNDGSVDLDGSVITYAGLEPVLINVGTVDDMIFNLPPGGTAANPTTAILENDPAVGQSRLRSPDNQFEETTFVNPSNSLTINGTAGVEHVTITKPDPGFSATVNVNAGAGNDVLTVDHSQASGGLVNLGINFAGQAGNDTLVITGDPSTPIARETYRVGPTQDAGTWILDPNDAMGPGAAGAADGTQMIVNFTGLAPVDTDTPAAVFDTVFTGANDNLTVEDGGDLNGVPSNRVVDNGGTFETFRFANKELVRLHLNAGADTANINYTTAAQGLQTLEIYGHAEAGISGLGADDDSRDTFVLLATPLGFDSTFLFGQGGDDGLRHIFVPDGANLSNVQGNVAFDGGAGYDFVELQNTNGPTANTVTLTNDRISGLAPADVDYLAVESVFIETSQFDDTVDILSTQLGTTYFISGDGGSDTFTFGNATANFTVNPDGTLSSTGGTLADILGHVIISPDFNFTAGASDTINIDGAGMAGLAAPTASIDVIANTTFTTFVGELASAPTTRLAGFAPANIDYYHNNYNAGTFAGTANDLAFLNVIGSQGADTINVNATTARNTTRLDGFQGDDTITINGDGLSANNLFMGGAGNDDFILNITNHIGQNAVYAVQSVEIRGDAPAGDTANRDRLTVNDNSGVARQLDYLFLNTQGNVNVGTNPASPNAGLFGANVPDGVLLVRSMETYIFNDAGENNDLVRVFGTTDDGTIGGSNPGDDILTVALLDNDSSALVFLNGAPYLQSPPAALRNPLNLPGVSGGGLGTDLLLRGLNPTTGITLDGNGDTGTAGTGNRAVVYAISEDDLVDSVAEAANTDIFGFGDGVLQPGAGAGNAYDSIWVDETGVTTVNNAAGPLTRVNINPGSFVQAGPAFAAQQAALIVNGGDEAGVQPTGIADEFNVTTSALFNIQVNGNLPDPATFVNGVPQGDQLNVSFPASINVFSDDQSPPNVTLTGQTTNSDAPFGVRFSSIERVNLTSINGIVNIIGDNATPGAAQDDYFKVRGGHNPFLPPPQNNGVGQFSLQIGGSWDPATGNVGTPPSGGLSGPIWFSGVSRINAMGGAMAGFDNNGNAIANTTDPAGVNALDITPYADNTPVGWGIETYWWQGNPVPSGGLQNPDLLIYNGVPGVSENIVIQPSGPLNGQLFSNNAATGTPIAVINYLFNTDIIVNGNDGSLGDTDNLFLRGTDPANPGTSGLDEFFIDLTAAGTGTEPLVIVQDNASGDLLYNLQDFTNFSTLNIETLGGSDFVSVIGRDDGSITINVNGGPPTGQGGVFDVDTVEVVGVVDDDDSFAYFPGATPDSGRLEVLRAGATAPTVVNFTGTERIVVDGGGGTGADTLTVNGTGGNDAITVQGTGPVAGTVQVNDGPELDFFDLGNTGTVLNLNGGDGDDVFSIAGLGDTMTVNVDGGNPTASDVVIVNVATAAVISDLTVDGATITRAGEATVNVTGAELLKIVGDGSANLAIQGTIGNNTIVHTPGAVDDAGAVRVDSLLPVTYQNLGAGAVLTIDGLAGDDTLVVEGTPADDAFAVAGVTGAVSLNSRLVINQISIGNLLLQGFDGDDTFNIVGDHPFAGISVEGGNPSASDVLNFNGAGDDIEVDLDAQTVTEGLFGPVIFSGIEHVNINIGVQAANLTAFGTEEDDTLTYTPTGAQAGTFVLDGLNTVFKFTGLGTGVGTGVFTVDLRGDDGDHVIVLGTNSHDVITVDSPNRRVDVENVSGTVLAPIVLADTVETLTVRARLGNDTIIVVPALQAVAPAPGFLPHNLLVHIDGGPPSASDALVVAGGVVRLSPNDPVIDIVPLGADDFAVVNRSRRSDEGVVRVFRNAVPMPDISYIDVEIVSPLVDPVDPNTGDPNLLLLGPDMFEGNETRATAAYLGSGDVINVKNLAIFPNSEEHRFVPADQDYFRVVAGQTGMLDFHVYFRMFDTALLPARGDINIEVLDGAGNVIAGDPTVVPAGQPGFGTFDDTPDARIRIPAVQGQTYYLRVFGEDNLVVNGYDLSVFNEAPPVPFDIELKDAPADGTTNPPGGSANSDTGRSQFDNITYDATPTIFVRLDDAIFLNDLPGNAFPGTPPDEVIAIPHNPDVTPADANTDPGFRVGIFVENNTHSEVLLGFAQPATDPLFAGPGVYEFTFVDPLADGSWFISARVQMIDPADVAQSGWGARSLSMEIIVDTQPPPVFFGDPNVADDGLHPDSDSGVLGSDPILPPTWSDRITNDTTPTFWGTAEANAIIRAYIDVNQNGVVDGNDIFIGMTVAEPLDGTNQFPNGYWELTSAVNMNDPAATNLNGLPSPLPYDGLRQILVTAEDVAGNLSDPESLQIFIDTQGPQVTGVWITGSDHDLFAQKGPAGNRLEPTPLVWSLSIDVEDLPLRVAGFLYDALPNAGPTLSPGNYQLRGDYVGLIAIESIQFIPDPVLPGRPATGTIVLKFFDPLPDDRYTLTLSDRLVDPAGNPLDGETNAIEPQNIPQFPSGDGVPGGDFVARFTVDSRPEVAVWAAGSVYVDTNGNFFWDPNNVDATNRDIMYKVGYTTDHVFAGQFVAPDGVPDGFDRLGVYGRVSGVLQWRLDTTNDGVLDLVRPVLFAPALGVTAVTGIPVAGNFDGNAATGHQVGLFDGTTWYLDTTGDFVLDTAIPSDLRGYPIVGDFDGDGHVDLATWNYQLRRFEFDLTDNTPGMLGGWTGAVNDFIIFDFIGARHRPVAADMDGDGTTDVGLWVPDRAGMPDNTGEWYFLMSNDFAETNRDPGTVATLKHEFSPTPLGDDLYARFGHEFAIPLVGNFDPPVGAAVQPVPTPDQIGVHRNDWFSLDMDGDGQWDPAVDQSIRFGGRDATPIIGDFNGDGVDQIGVYRNGWFSLDMDGDGVWDPAVDKSIRFGGRDATPIIGDWNGDGTDYIGTWRNGWFSLDMDGDGEWDSSIDTSIRFGGTDATPIIGTWSPSDGQALHAAGLPADTAMAGPALDQAALEPIVVAAIADWDALLGLNAAQLDRLQRVEFVIADLPGTMLGVTRQDTIYLDPHAAGFGWYINPTDADFQPGGRLGELVARPGTDAVHRIDLLTAVMHELGHVLGHDHTDSGLMQPALGPGIRWPAESGEASALTSEQAQLDDSALEPARLDAYFAALS